MCMLRAGLMDYVTVTMFSPATAWRALSPETGANGNLNSRPAAVFERRRYDAAMTGLWNCLSNLCPLKGFNTNGRGRGRGRGSARKLASAIARAMHLPMFLAVVRTSV